MPICAPFEQEQILIDEANVEEDKALQSQRDASIAILSQVEDECSEATGSPYHETRCNQKAETGHKKINEARTSAEINDGLEHGKQETCGYAQLMHPNIF
jgi:hypothetical protein